MYRLGYRINVKKHWRLTLSIIVLIILIVGGLGFWYLHYRSGTVILKASKPTTTNVKANSPATKTFDEGEFTIALPKTWKLIDHQTSPYITYTWKETAQNEDSRLITAYVNAAPATYAINRLLPVSPAGNGLTVGTMSDNCIIL